MNLTLSDRTTYTYTCKRCGYHTPGPRDWEFKCPACAGKSKDDTIAELRARVSQLETEVQTLRLYGNKDCTAQADEALAKAAADTAQFTQVAQ